MWCRDFGARAALLAALLLMSACGFQLRGTHGHIESINIIGATAAPLTSRSFREVMEQRGIQEVPTGAGVVRVHMIDERSIRRSVATTDVFDAAEYELRLELDVSISRDENVLLPEATLISQRVYAVDSGNLSASYEEQALLLSEMRTHLSEQLIRQVEFITRPAT